MAHPTTESNPKGAGRPRKPDEIKRRLGNPGQRPLKDGKPLSEIPTLPAIQDAEMPEDLGPAGQEFWATAFGPTSSAFWVGDTDRQVCVFLANLADELAEARKKQKATRSRETWLQYSKDQERIRGLMLPLLREIGFTPSDRSRLGGGEVKRFMAPTSALDARRKASGS